jgi:hypothetical protein
MLAAAKTGHLTVAGYTFGPEKVTMTSIFPAVRFGELAGLFFVFGA